MSQQNGFVDIVEGNFDAGVRIGDDILKDMVAVRIAPDIRFVVIGSSTYLAERGLPLHPSQLEKHDCINIRLSPTGPLYGWEFVRQGENIVKKVDGQLTFCKRAARTVLTGMCYSVGSATRQGSSSLTRFIGQSAITSSTWRR
ncbi:hypothetical protein P1O77_004934 [Escherichia coli]|uniref:hypothetical protein n=1 Tax=Enterobacteriaceae TaxID=543 RepID=UPI0009B8B74E|nr:hypothetical protein CES94_04135 [Escherichia coli]MBS9490390.1 hypothetical protein [Citrobacter braakii]EFN4830770.1 hypothetical protein [Escherichia coli]EJZ6203825.1 hypothetical protein [Escherichia coli]EKP2271267.1 hypothetical protein [Escherichia coli]